MDYVCLDAIDFGRDEFRRGNFCGRSFLDEINDDRRVGSGFSGDDFGTDGNGVHTWDLEKTRLGVSLDGANAVKINHAGDPRRLAGEGATERR